MMESFDPFTQNATILAADGKTPIPIPLPMVDRFHTQSISICLNYGAQFGACLIMLAVILVMTPSSKFARPSSILHISSLTICTIRMALLGAYFPSHFNEFYTVWGGDYSHVPQSDFTTSIVANTFSLLLVIFVEAALMNQAWTMVSLWPTPWKYTISALSALVTLYTIGWRIAFTVVQNETIVNLVPPRNHRWVVQWMVIGNVLSICWFCLIFNIKLISHIITNRGLLPSYQAMSPMEVLVATNGVLMIVPVIFAGLEWGHFNNFESASLTLTSVAIILPLGTLAAQRMTHTSNLSGSSRSSSNRYGTTPGRGGSTARLKPSGIATNHSKTAAQVAISSRCESEAAHQDDFDISELELGKLDQEDKVNGIHVHVKHNLVQCEERV